MYNLQYNHTPLQDAATQNVAATQLNESLVNQFMRWAQVSETTFATYIKALNQFFGWMREHGIAAPTNNDALAYAEYLKTSKKPTTTQSYLNACKQFFKWCNQFEYYPNIMRYVKGAKIDTTHHKKDALRLDQIQMMLQQHANGTTLKTKRDYAIILLMSCCGLRCIELERANIGDISNNGNQCVLWVQGKGRTDKNECVEIPTMVERAINDYLALYPNHNNDMPLFVSASNHGALERMTKNSISRIIKTTMRDCGIDNERLTAHSCRHFAITQSLLNGATLEQAQQMARHKNINTTMIYNHAIDRANNHCESSVCNSIMGKGGAAAPDNTNND